MVFLDTNILLEVLLPGRPKLDLATNLLGEISDTTAISTLTVHLIFHFGRQFGIGDDILRAMVQRQHILALNSSDYNWAKLHEVGRDFEDALQVAVAHRNNCQQFITLDKKLAKRYAQILPIIAI